MAAVQPAQPTVRRMGRYALHGKIASGGMATLYFGRLLGHSGFARTVAIKLLHPQFAQDPEFSAMFLDEARLASRIRSPYVVPTLDVVSEDGELAIVMEYVHGQSLATLVRPLSDTDAILGSPAPPDVPVAVAVSVLGEALQGLQAAHEARGEDGAPLGIVHRDVSPQNILVGTDGLAHLIDFGVAKATGRLQTTREGQLKGKLAYMAPEQLRGEPVTRRSDLYAASVVLWETLVGRRLFHAGDEGATVTRVLMGEVEPPSKALRDDRGPAELQAIERLDGAVMRGLDRDPAKRFETAHDMAVALERCLPPANAAEVARWLEQAAGPALARRAAAIATIEGGEADGSAPPPWHAGNVDGPAQPTADASSISVVSGVSAGASSRHRRRARWLLAAGVLTSAAITMGRAPWRSPGAARSPVRTAPSAMTSSEPGAAASNPALPLAAATPSTGPSSSAPAPSTAAPSSSAPAPSTAAPSSSRPAPSTVAAPPKRGPAAPTRAAECDPPFTWDDQGKKHYKRQCL
jgi:eukaryotic-like serine/threonine-protein kinase